MGKQRHDHNDKFDYVGMVDMWVSHDQGQGSTC